MATLSRIGTPRSDAIETPPSPIGTAFRTALGVVAYDGNAKRNLTMPWSAVPEVASPAALHAAGEDLFTRVARPPGQGAAVILGSTHEVTGNFVFERDMIRRGVAKGFRTYLAEASPEQGRDIMADLPRLSAAIEKAGGVGAFIARAKQRSPGTWHDTLPLLLIHEAWRLGLKIDFVDHSTLDDDDPRRNAAMTAGIRRHMAKGEKVIAVLGNLHVGPVHRALAQDDPPGAAPRVASLQVVPTDHPYGSALLDQRSREPPPAGQGSMVRLSAAMANRLPR